MIAPATPAAKGLVPVATPISPGCVTAWVDLTNDDFEELHPDEKETPPHHYAPRHKDHALATAAPSRPSADFRALKRLVRKSAGEFHGLRELLRGPARGQVQRAARGSIGRLRARRCRGGVARLQAVFRGHEARRAYGGLLALAPAGRRASLAAVRALQCRCRRRAVAATPAGRAVALARRRPLAVYAPRARDFARDLLDVRTLALAKKADLEMLRLESDHLKADIALIAGETQRLEFVVAEHEAATAGLRDARRRAAVAAAAATAATDEANRARCVSAPDDLHPGIPRPAEMDAARRLVYVAERGVVNVYWKTELGLVHPPVRTL